jgi:hypothetical protein
MIGISPPAILQLNLANKLITLASGNINLTVFIGVG